MAPRLVARCAALLACTSAIPTSLDYSAVNPDALAPQQLQSEPAIGLLGGDAAGAGSPASSLASAADTAGIASELAAANPLWSLTNVSNGTEFEATNNASVVPLGAIMGMNESFAFVNESFTSEEPSVASNASLTDDANATAAAPSPSPSPPPLPPLTVVEATLSVASTLAETLTAENLASNLISAAIAAASTNVTTTFTPTATVTVFKKERIAAPIPTGVTQADMINAFGTLLCNPQLPPECAVSRAPPTLGEMRSMASLQALGAPTAAATSTVGSIGIGMTAITFQIERELNESDPRSLGPPLVDETALAATVSSIAGVSVSASQVPTASHGSSVEARVTVTQEEDVLSSPPGNNERMRLLDIPNHLASQMSVSPSSFAYVSSPNVAGMPHPPPPPAYGAPGTMATAAAMLAGSSKHALRMQAVIDERAVDSREPHAFDPSVKLMHLDPKYAAAYRAANGRDFEEASSQSPTLRTRAKAAAALLAAADEQPTAEVALAAAEAEEATANVYETLARVNTRAARKRVRGEAMLQEAADGLMVNNKTNKTSEWNMYIEEIDMPEPHPQDMTPDQARMHYTYANENASLAARFRFLFPNYPTSEAPIAHVNRNDQNLLECPGNTSRMQKIALLAYARTALSAAPSCYVHPGEKPSHLMKVRPQDPGMQTAPARVLVSKRSKFVFLGLPGNHSSGIEEYLMCTYGAKVVSAEKVVAGATDKYGGYSVVSVDFNATVRALHAYGVTINQMKDTMFASEGALMMPGTDIGLPRILPDRIEAMKSIFAGENATSQMPGSVDGFLSYMTDAHDARVIGCKNDEWWPTHAPTFDFSPVDVLSDMHSRDAAILTAFGKGGAPTAAFNFRAGKVYNDTAKFEAMFEPPAKSKNDDAVCLQPLSAADARVPEVGTLRLLHELSAAHNKPAQRLVCTITWSEHVCGEEPLPEACGAEAFLLKPTPSKPPKDTMYAWLHEALAGIDGEPGTDLHQKAVVRGSGAAPKRDFEAEEDALICSRLDAMEKTQASFQVAIIVSDSRVYLSPKHPGLVMWEQYAEFHGYHFVALHPGGDLIKAEKDEQDWMATTRMLEVLLSDDYAHVHYFMYVELDQWMTHPQLRVDDLFRNTGVDRCKGPIMAAARQGMTRTVEGSSEESIDSKTLIFRRAVKTRQLLFAWSNASYAHPDFNESVPMSRQWAFMHNPNVYATFKDEITLFDNILAGKPFASRIAHVYEGAVDGHYDGELARKAQEVYIASCVGAALNSGEDYTCSVNPPMVGGSCKKCKKQLSLKLPNGTHHTWEATQCCSERDAAIPVQKYYELAEIFQAKDTSRILNVLVDIYESRKEVPAYHSRLHHSMPELATPIPDEWLAAEPKTQTLDPSLSQRLYYKTPEFMPSCEASGTCDSPPGCHEQLIAVSKLPTTEENQWHDYRTCMTEGSAGSASPLNSYCTSDVCKRMATSMRTDKTKIDGGIGIVTIDSRTEHPAITAWRSYCDYNNYTYMHLISSATPEDIASVQDVNMLFDWRTNQMLLTMLANESYAHVDYFLYTELDQWISAPASMKLEPLFEAHGLVAKTNFMVALEEYPCRDVRGGGVFNMGTFLFARGKRMHELLEAWFKSKAHGGEHNASWPARQGAFSHDPTVYNAFKDEISIMPSACPLGSPYGIAIGHVLGGSIVGAFDPEPGRDFFAKLILPCVLDALETGADHVCSLHPPSSGGTCLKCEQAMSIERDGVLHNITATNCCGDYDASMAIAKFRETAALFEAKDVDKIVSLLKDVYEGRAPMEAYALIGEVMPSTWRAAWNSAVDIEIADDVGSAAADMAAELERLKGYPSPPPPPPVPVVCDSPACLLGSWDGPRGLVFIAPPKTFDVEMLYVLRNVHLQTGMPYAWGGKNAGWLKDAKARGEPCAAGVDATLDPANGDPSFGRCFLEYMANNNLTAEGIFISHDFYGPKHVNMIKAVMPDAKYITTIRDPWEQALEMFVANQAPILNTSSVPLDPSSDCTYDGPGYRARHSAYCFVQQFIDPQLKRCKDENDLFSSQLCAIGDVDAPTGAHVSKMFTVLPSEGALDALLATLALEFGFDKTAIARVHESLDTACSYGSLLSIPPYDDVKNMAESLYPKVVNDSQWHELATLEAQFSVYAAEVGVLHKRAHSDAAKLVRRYKSAMGFPANYTPCWAVHFTSPPMRNFSAAELPHKSSDRWTLFDNSNNIFGQTRLDQCLPGLPEAINVVSSMDSHPVARTSGQAAHLMQDYLQRIRAKNGKCFNTTGYTENMRAPRHSDALVSDTYKIAFETSAKSASMSATSYMQCRFDAAPNRTSYEDYTRLMVMRQPDARAISAVFEMIMHYIAILRLPPAALVACADAWPKGLGDIRSPDNGLFDEKNNTWPPMCLDAFARNPYTKDSIPHEMYASMSMDEATARATADSSLLNAIWELPSGCRQIGRTQRWGQEETLDPGGNHSHTGTTWWCEEEECYTPCEIDEGKMLDLFAHALSDVARQTMLGCGQQMFADEHMWPQSVHVSRAGRADAVLRLEDIEEDSKRFEHYVESHLKLKLPPAPQNCSIASTHVNNGTVIEPALSNQTMAESLIAHHPKLQRWICVMYWSDYACGGYELPPACRAPKEEWFDDTIQELLDDSPLTMRFHTTRR